MNEILESISKLFLDLGASIALPILITLFGVALGERLPRAFRAGVTIGIGFIGIGLIVGLLFGAVGPAATGLAERFSVDLSIVDVGWPASAAIAFGAKVGAIIIPLCLALNVLLLAVGLTKTFDIDLWNYWHFAFIGGLVASITESYAKGIATAAIAMLLTLALADWAAPRIQKQYNYPDISFPHGTSAPYALLAFPLNALFDRIPGLKNWKADPDSIQKRFGVFGESMILGLVIGLILGLAGFGIDDPRTDIIAILGLGINLAAAMLLLPRMVAILMEGLVPISEAARSFVQKRFPGRKFYIGLDSAVVIGQPAVIATSLILVPVSLLTAIALSPLGNKVLPLVDLATIPFIVALMVPIFGGNIIRSVIGGAIVIGGGLFIATAVGPTLTMVAVESGFENTTGGTISSLVDGANPMTGLFYWLSDIGGWTGIGILGAVSLAFAIWVKLKVKATVSA
ncbi:MAG: PTS galactitol transporter subunit IIC [actinobacterium acAMD-5]|nr:MAG: PTS galactitol transporter subunit IIC [actinobacterium acAMD-5]